VRSFEQSFEQSFERSFVRSFVRSFEQSFEQGSEQSFEQSFVRSFVQSFVQSFCRALVELRAGLPLSFVPQGWRRGRKRSALVFTARLGEVELGPLRRRIPLNVARV
jgi:hypothetical protein